MMRNLFISFALLFSGLLAGCGFTPMHSATGPSSPLAGIDVQMQKGSDVVNNQAGFFVAQRLRDRIGSENSAAPYILKIDPKYSRRRLGLTVGDIASRYDVTVTAKWELLDAKTGKTLKRDSSVSIVTFGAPSGPFGVITADNVGVEQSAKQTADKIIVQVARYFAEDNKKAKK